MSPVKGPLCPICKKLELIRHEESGYLLEYECQRCEGGTFFDEEVKGNGKYLIPKNGEHKGKRFQV